MGERESGGGSPSGGAVVVEGFELGPFMTNCYLVRVEGAPACWLIDASFEPGAMIERVRGGGLEPKALILTHAHVDHIAGVEEVLEAFAGIPLMIHEAERGWLSDPSLNLSRELGLPVRTRDADRTLAEGEELELAGTKWRVIHTPGHSPGGICLYHEPEGGGGGGADDPVLIAGDALFAGSIGRTDFPTSDHDALIGAIREKLYTLPGATRVYPGHGPATTIERERRGNPFVRG